MKFFIACLLFAAVSAFPQAPAAKSIGAAGAAGAAAPAGAPAAQPFVNPYGVKVYGMGLNNLWAQPHNPFEVYQHLAVANRIPGTLVRIDADGDVVLTDQNGWEIENIPDQFGRNQLELYGL